MNQSGTIQQLSYRLKRIELEISALREELKALPEPHEPQPDRDAGVLFDWIDKTALRKQMQQLFQTLSIQGEPTGAELLQRKMHKAGLSPNELSQSIIATREK